jgi:hypothetical protein
VSARAWAAICLGAAVAAEPARGGTEAEEEKPRIAFSVGDLWITPIVGPAYTPELGFLVAGGALFSYRLDAESLRSSAPVSFSYTTTGATLFSISPTLYLLSDRLRIDAYYGQKQMTDNYFGVGYAAGNLTPLGPETTQYHLDYLDFDASVLWRILPSFFVGPSFDLNRSSASELAPLMQQDPYVVAQGTYFINTGLGAVLRYDSRDYPANALRGIYLSALYLFYSPSFGGTTSYRILDLDYRQYQSLGRPGLTLAWNIRTRSASGDVPWTEMSRLGSGNGLRGYREGRYRDNTILYGLLELRWLHLTGIDPQGEPHFGIDGFVTWVGLGTMGSDYAGFNCLLPSFGVGYRLIVQGRMTLRLDAGVGRDSTAVYFTFGETF